MISEIYVGVLLKRIIISKNLRETFQITLKVTNIQKKREERCQKELKVVNLLVKVVNYQKKLNRRFLKV